MGIGSILQRLLAEKGINVNELSKAISVSPQTLYSIIKRDNMKVDFDVLIKICNYLNADVEEFYNSKRKTVPEFSITAHEMKVLNAYRNNPHLQAIVDNALKVAPEAVGSVSDAIKDQLEISSEQVSPINSFKRIPTK